MNSSFPWRPGNWPQSVPRPLPRAKLGVDYDTSWASTEPLRLVRAGLLETFTRPVMQVLASPTLIGTDELEGLESPVIFAGNHQSHVDTSLVLCCLPPRFRHKAVVAAAADYFFDRHWKAVVSAGLLGAIPIERSRPNRRSYEVALDLLNDGWNVVIFPEGGRSPDGWGQPFRAGAGLLVQRSGVPVVPVHLAGTRQVQAKGEKGLHRFPTTVSFGAPLRLGADEGIRQFTVRMEAAVATLADEQSSDWYSARRRAAAGTTRSMQGPEVAPWRKAWALPGKSTTARRPWPKV